MRRRDGLTSDAKVTIHGAPDEFNFNEDDGVRTIITRDSPSAPLGYSEDFSLAVDIKRGSNVRTIYVPQGPLRRWSD